MISPWRFQVRLGVAGDPTTDPVTVETFFLHCHSILNPAATASTGQASFAVRGPPAAHGTDPATYFTSPRGIYFQVAAIVEADGAMPHL